MKKPEIAYAGFYKVVVSSDKECRDIRAEYEFPNLITNNGLELIGGATVTTGNNAILNRFCVGSSTVPPAVTDTSLHGLVATTTINTTQTSSTSSYPLGYCEGVYSSQFAAGAAAGNLSEIGIGPASNSLFSRALILDASGNPTTITVLNYEYLTVYYTLRCYIPKVDQTFTFVADIEGVATTITATVRPCRANDSNSWNIRFGENGVPIFYAGDIGAATGGPSGDYTNNAPYSTQAPYVAGSYTKNYSVNLGVAIGNVSGGLIKSLSHSCGPGTWQIGFSTPIPKNNSRTATFSYGYTWARAE